MSLRDVLGPACVLGVALLHAAACAGQAPRVLDDLREAAAWTASASDQVRSRLRRDAADGSLCLDYDFAGVSGYAVMRRALPMDWPANFDLRARLKGRGGVNDLQVKLVDASGDNVWWMARPNETLPQQLTERRIRARHLSFAWGPTADRTLRRTEFIEFVIAAGRDRGAGTLCLGRLAFEPREPDPPQWPEPELRAGADTLTLDFQRPREFNGVALHWPAGVRPAPYRLQASDDGRHWRTLRRVHGSDGALDTLFLPEQEARWLRVQGRLGTAPPRLALRSAAQWPDFNAVLAEQAAALPRGDLPRAWVGEQNHWTLVGVDGGGARSALLNEDGGLEFGRGGYSVEPVLVLDDGQGRQERITWANLAPGQLTQHLRPGGLPMPQVRWAHPRVGLSIEAAADGQRNAPRLLARYTVHNPGAAPLRATLWLLVRPWQVNPPQQFLSTPGGASPVRELAWDGRRMKVNGQPSLHPTRAPARVRALPQDGGLGLDALATAPALRRLDDPLQHASALLAFPLDLAPGGRQTVGWAAPLDGARAQAVANAPDEAALAAAFDAAAARWQARLHKVTLRLPSAEQRLGDTLAASLAHILMSRDGPALRPGTRSYARTWIRDGAMMLSGLLRLGEVDAAREFVDWFGPQVYASGKVPCCIDPRGADPVVENDSHGQYLFAVAELWRHTGDRALLARHWPTVQRVVAWIDAQRAQERGARNAAPERARYRGLMPPSISHEGYSDKPAYSYWDDFWTLRGLRDAVELARAMGDGAAERQWTASRDVFTRDFMASVVLTAHECGQPWIAGAADRCDFDATSTTLALDPAQAQDVLPAGLLAATFERYWDEMSARSDGRRAWTDWTPYELRTVGALARLGQGERAHAMLDFFFAYQRPAGWHQWAEVVVPGLRERRFLGDMPHAWVSSDYIRSALDLLAYPRTPQRTLVLGAGLRAAWLDAPALGITGLSTPHGRLDWQLSRRAGGWTLSVPTALKHLPGGLRLAWPEGLPLPAARRDGQPLAWDGRELPLGAAPLRIELDEASALP